MLRVTLGVPDWGVLDALKLIGKSLFCKSEFVRETQRLEKNICKQLGARYCIATGMGRQALLLGLKSAGFSAGDGIIVPSYICESVVAAILRADCVPEFIDIGSDLLMDSNKIEPAISIKSKAILVAHLFGNFIDMRPISAIAEKYGLAIIDDAAQAYGTSGRYGTLGSSGLFGVLSFGPYKPFCATKGGAIVTNSEEIFEKAKKQVESMNSSNVDSFNRLWKILIKLKYRKYFYRVIRKHQKKRKEVLLERSLFEDFKITRIANYDAGLVNAQLSDFAKIQSLKSKLEYLFVNKLEEFPFVRIFNETQIFKVPNKIVLMINTLYGDPNKIFNVDNLMRYLYKNGIESEKGYYPVHMMDKYSHFKSNSLVNTERIWDKILLLPLNLEMSEKNVNIIANTINQYLGKYVNRN
jgi:dTDP-4-amino-4,6-dideoxygalactose transaminase